MISARALLKPVAVLVTVAAMALPACSDARFRATHVASAPHVPSSPLDVYTENGSVTVSTSPVPDVSITADVRATTQQRADDARLVTSREPDGTLRVRVDWPGGQRLSNEGAALTIRVPDARDPLIRTSNASIDVSGLSGSAVLETSNASITASDHAGPVNATTSNASIRLTSPAGPVRANSTNGAINIQSAHAPVFAETSNSSIDISFAPDAVGPVTAVTSNASVTLTLPPAFTGSFEAETNNASIRADKSRFAPLVDFWESDSSNWSESLRFRFRADGPRSSARTSNGSVRVRLLD